MKSSNYFSLVFLGILQLARLTVAANGTCISSPQSSCTTLVALCVNKVASGRVASNNFWSVPECFTGATCAGVSHSRTLLIHTCLTNAVAVEHSAAVLDAACCAGTCMTLPQMNSLNYNKVYAPMVGSCAFDPNGCPVTWTDFVNYFYNTVQGTLAMDWPTSGDAVLAWWAEIATWTGFCSGTNCVNGQIPYTNLDDWLRYSSEVLLTTPGNPPIRDPLSPIRDENEDDWDPVTNGPCPYDDSSLCGYEDGPQEPPEPDSASFATSSASPKPSFATLSLTARGDTSSSLVPSSIADDFLPRNVPPPVYITNGTDRVAVDLNLDGGSPPERRSFSIVERVTENMSTHLLQHRAPTLSKDPCKGSIETPSPLPVITYYCDYLPKICANIRSSGELLNDEVILTYDPFGTGKRRSSVCSDAETKKKLRAAGCDETQHDPAYWDVSCDEFPFNSVLEGGKKNGAITAGVPTQEQSYQSKLQGAVAGLYRIQGDSRSIWSRPRNLKRLYPGMCHEYIVRLVDTRPVGTSFMAVGTLYSGGAFIGNNGAGHTMTIEHSKAKPPPAPHAPSGYPTHAVALNPPGYYVPWDCSPCDPDAPLVPFQEFGNDTISTPTTTPAFEAVAAPSACTKTNTRPTITPTPTSDAATNAAEAAVAAAAAQAALSSANESAATMAAAKAAVDAAKAAAAAAAAANSPAAMASAIASASYAQQALESALASLTDIFGTGTVPAAIASIIDQASIVGTDAASTIVDTWNTKPPQSDPVPPPSDPAHDPSTNSGGGANVPPAACFGAGSSGQLTVSSGFIWLSTGTSTEGAQLTDAGSPAYFGLNMALDGGSYLGSLCSGVYGWFKGGPQPSFQVGCSSHEFGSYWNTVKQQYYAFPTSGNGYAAVCGNSPGTIYSCLQSKGFTPQLTPVSFAWS